MNRSDPINRNRLQEYSGGEIEFEIELLNLFIEDAQQHLDTIDVAISSAIKPTEGAAEGDYSEGLAGSNLETIYQEAHHLKGASGTIGAERFEAISTQLEQAARQGQPCIQHLCALKIAFAELTIQVSQWPN
ncbi:MAG: Hpt domain-containing protein [Thermosynechococcaceae cyanobacterium]